METYKFSKLVQDFISTVKDVEATESQLKDVVSRLEDTKVGFNLVTDKVFLLAVKAIKNGFGTIKTAEFVAGTIALELYDEARDAGVDKETAKSNREANKIVTISITATATEKKTKKAVMTRAWEVAKEAQAKFGGKASQYLSGALKSAWAE